MKVIFYDANNHGDTLHAFNNPEGHEFIVKPNARIVKIVHKDGSIITYPLVDRKYTIVHDLQLDIEELHVEFRVLGDKK